MKKKHRLLMVLILVLAIVGAVVAPNYVNHNKGVQAFAAKDYDTAIMHLRKDRLFSEDLLKEVLWTAGEANLEAGHYIEAANYFRQYGEGGEAKVCQAECGRARAMLQTSISDALALLDTLAYNPDTAAMIDGVRLEAAEKYLEQENWTAAIAVADEIPDRNLSGLENVYNCAYYGEGWSVLMLLRDAQEPTANLIREMFRRSWEHFDRCPSYEDAQRMSGLLKAIVNKDYELAARQIQGQEVPEVFTVSEWKTLLEKLLTDTYFDGWKDDVFETHWVLALFYEKPGNLTSRELGDAMAAVTDHGGPGVGMSYQTDIAIPGIDEILKITGSAPAGKILFLRQNLQYPYTARTNYSVFSELMYLLPEEYYPRSLDEVEFVVVLTYDKTNAGYYTGFGGIRTGYNENATVKVYRVPGKTVLYNSGTVYGPKMGNSASNPGENVALSGGRPMLGEKIIAALNAISKKIG